MSRSAPRLDETRALARLVEDLQTISLAEAGQLPLIREPVDIGELLLDISTSFNLSAAASGIQLVLESGLGEPAEAEDGLMVSGDPGRLYQVLTNLVANALRHTPTGGQVVMDAQAERDQVRIVVEDTGSGIAASDLPHVFDRFWRGDRSRARSDESGGGLGLAIVRQLVEAHDGTVDVQSIEGEGSVFSVLLPRYQAAGAVQPEDPTRL
jgi:two-component system sensor histidine kinase BaeS